MKKEVGKRKVYGFSGYGAIFENFIQSYDLKAIGNYYTSLDGNSQQNLLVLVDSSHEEERKKIFSEIKQIYNSWINDGKKELDTKDFLSLKELFDLMNYLNSRANNKVMLGLHSINISSNLINYLKLSERRPNLNTNLIFIYFDEILFALFASQEKVIDNPYVFIDLLVKKIDSTLKHEVSHASRTINETKLNYYKSSVYFKILLFLSTVFPISTSITLMSAFELQKHDNNMSYLMFLIVIYMIKKSLKIHKELINLVLMNKPYLDFEYDYCYEENLAIEESKKPTEQIFHMKYEAMQFYDFMQAYYRKLDKYSDI